MVVLARSPRDRGARHCLAQHAFADGSRARRELCAGNSGGAGAGGAARLGDRLRPERDLAGVFFDAGFLAGDPCPARAHLLAAGLPRRRRHRPGDARVHEPGRQARRPAVAPRSSRADADASGHCLGGEIPACRVARCPARGLHPYGATERSDRAGDSAATRAAQRVIADHYTGWSFVSRTSHRRILHRKNFRVARHGLRCDQRNCDP